MTTEEELKAFKDTVNKPELKGPGSTVVVLGRSAGVVPVSNPASLRL